jgi:hypothetical protein
MQTANITPRLNRSLKYCALLMFPLFAFADGPTVQCTGIPFNTIIVTPGTGICPNTSAFLTLNNSNFLGLLFTWSVAPASNGPYTLIAGATQSFYATPNLTVSTWYKASVTCTNGGGYAVTPPALVVVGPTPSISVSTPTICAGQVYSFNPSLSPGNNPTYIFSNGAPTVSPAGNTTYTVTGMNQCAMVSSVVTVTVYPLPNVIVNSGTICLGGTFTLQPSGALSYLFSGGSAVVSPTISSPFWVAGISAQGCSATASTSVWINPALGPTISVNSGTICLGNFFIMAPGGAITYTFSSGSATVSPGTNTVYTVTGTGPGGCLAAIPALANVTVFPNTLPVISVAGGTICKGGSFTLSPTGGVSYTFSSGSNIVSPPGTSSFSVTGTGTNGCTSSNTAVATVIVNSSLGPTITVNSGSVCPGNSFAIIAAGAANFTVISASAIVYPSSSTVYAVIGQATNGCVSSNTAYCNVFVYNPPLVAVNSGSVCQGNSFLIQPAGASTYSYSLGPLINPNSTSAYSVVGYDIHGCASSVAVGTVIIYPIPTITISRNNTSPCRGTLFQLTAQGAQNYTWSTGQQGIQIAVSPTATSNYQVTGTSANGCTASATFPLKIVDCTGINETEGDIGIELFPNPAHASLHIRLNGVTELSEVSMFSLDGKPVFRSRIEVQEFSINVTDIAEGIYFLHVKRGQGDLHARMIVLRN